MNAIASAAAQSLSLKYRLPCTTKHQETSSDSTSTPLATDRMTPSAQRSRDQVDSSCQHYTL